MPDIAGITAALITAALYAGAIWCAFRVLEGPEHKNPQPRKVYSVDKRPVSVRIRAFLSRWSR